MAKKNIDLAVVLHDDCDYKDWLVELKERFYSHRLKASCATNGYLLDFYWKLGRDIEAKQYTNTYGSGFLYTYGIFADIMALGMLCFYILL